MQFQKGLIPWNKDKKWPQEIKRKISKSVKVLWQNPEYRRHMSGVHRGQVSSMEGKHHTKETKERISKRLIGRCLLEATKNKIGEAEKGEKHWNWKGIELRAHHILSFSKYPKLKFEVNNGITLCKSCHQKFHGIYGRKANTKKEIKEFFIT